MQGLVFIGLLAAAYVLGWLFGDKTIGVVWSWIRNKL